MLHSHLLSANCRSRRAAQKMPDSIHPILRSLSLSPQQWAAIDHLRDDALITAGAGTGKTRTLTARYLQLLAQGAPVRSIVAITFTRKAAREMRNRIREQVWRYVEREDIDDAERERWRSIAVQLDAARISTIHSLCQEILRTHPAEAQVDPDFQTLEEGKAALLQEESVDEALFWAAGQEQVAGLLASTPEKTVREAVKTLLAGGGEAWSLLMAFPNDPDALLARWEKWLIENQLARLRELMAEPEWRDAQRFIETIAPRDAADKLAVQWARAREALLLLEKAGADGGFREGVQTLRHLNFTGGRQTAWPGGKDGKNAVAAALKRLRLPFKSDSKFPGSGNDAWLGESLNQEDARVARALLQLRAIALQAGDIYAARKADLQALDFDDLEERAIRLLEQSDEVRAWWQSQVQALLVDEFQDTNARQTRLLHLLDGGRGVRFLVGDGKQSIYRFRGADVEVFQNLRRDFERRGKRVAPLDETWRAHEALVHGLNSLLEPVLGEARHPWQVPFEALQPARPAGPRCPGPPFIEFHLATGSKQEGALKRAAQAVVWRLQEMMDRGRCKPGDVAILTRASGSFSAYEDALDAAGIPFLTLAGRGFYQRPEIRDLVTVMRAAADPTDDVALAGALRSPGLGLSDAALYRLARQRDAMSQADGPRASLWQTLSEAVEAVEPEQIRAERARSLIQQLNGMAGRAAVADLLKFYLDESDYLAILAAAGQPRAVRNVSKLLDDVQRAGFVQVEAFIEYVKLARSTSMREGEAPVVAEGAVQIMSVHRAKGLEFPIVVLGDVTYRGRSRSGLLLSAGQIAWKLPLLPGEKQGPVLYEALERVEAGKDEAEDRRLLYVAATRAQEALLISGVASARGWLEMLAQAVPLDVSGWKEAVTDARREVYTLAGSATPVHCTLIGPEWTPGPRPSAPQSAPRAPRFEPRMLARVDGGEEALDEKLRAAEEKPERRVWRVVPPEERRAWAPSWLVGALIHRAIEIERFPDDPRFDGWFRASARGLGVSDEAMLDNALWRARSTLKRLQRSALWRELITADRRIHEHPYAYADASGRVDRGVIDVIWQKNGRWFLVDFKTDRVRDAAAMRERIQEMAYEAQVRRYIRAMASFLGKTPAAYLCFLDVGGEVAVIEVADGPDDGEAHSAAR